MVLGIYSFGSGNTHKLKADASNDVASPPKVSVPATPSPLKPQRSTKRTHDQMEAEPATHAGLDASPDPLSSKNSNTRNNEDALGPLFNIRVGKGHDLMELKEHLYYLRKSKYFRTEITKNPDRTDFNFDDEEATVFCRIRWWLHQGDIFPPPKKGIGESGHFDSFQDTQDETEALEYEYEDTQGNMTHGTAMLIGQNGLEEDQDSQVSDSDASQTLQLPPMPLDALELAKVYAFAERLQIPELCNMVMDKLADRLGQHSVSGADLETPSDALIYAYKRLATTNHTTNYLKKILIDFTSLVAPIYDFTDVYAAAEIPPQLMLDLIRKFPMVRDKTGLDSKSWAAHYEKRKSEYHFRRRPQAWKPKY